MIHRISPLCNVRTGEHVHNPRQSVDITLPQFRAVLSVQEAQALAESLLAAVEKAKTLTEQPK